MSELIIREAKKSDVEAIVALFADDALGGHGDTTGADALPGYRRAFIEIEQSTNDTLYVAEMDGQVVGTFQLTFVRSMTARGSRNMIIEAVQTKSTMRGRGIGARMITFAIDKAKSEDVRLIQLMSNNVRVDAHRFYERLGFSHSHAGFKMKLRD
ncbi:GNAT family N-acetyltransferase [Limoniibacter endophyticus]|uniref:Acetyltransferase n=1 Tax=Limoniibacter endophyticus TaxID=1565040 RepID=A0A8J3DF16_9HYPH|nr:GNAT family N-acetyltransferase [Limoniibacter endophyticus]GHC62602.1 acetyltransferase [Limoniibacter endophyticus]